MRPFRRWMTLVACAAVIPWVAGRAAEPRTGDVGYRLEARAQRKEPLRARFTEAQLRVLEKLNRADVRHLERLPVLVVPEEWNDDELAYSPLPAFYPASQPWPTFLVVHLPGQVFGGYEYGRLVRWGPVSSGKRATPTDPGLFRLNWRSKGRHSTVNPDWYMPWYFNFNNREGLALHQYSLPGYPASHGCLRLLERDARWLFEWGEPTVLERSGVGVIKPGTPVFIVGQYDFGAPPPWRSLEWLETTIELPPVPGAAMTSATSDGCPADAVPER